MDTRKMTGLEIYKCGIELLIDKLGPAGMLRFFWQNDPGKGNYSVDRHKLPQPDMDMILKEIQQVQDTEPSHRKKWATASYQVDTQKMTDREVYQLGIAYLKDELGPVGFARFLKQYKQLAGTYTMDRHKHPMPNIDMIVKENEQEN